ncbi:MAG: DNA polymerase III subunit alpha [Flavobacteriaceae bacterium]|nr:DNA polymerase III subunit alpha [Flavobacteriaceae bacterium]
MFLIFDTETTGLPKRYNAPVSATDNWPRCVQIAWQLHDRNGELIEHQDYLIQPKGFDIPYDSERIHGISTQLADQKGLPLDEVLLRFKSVLGQAVFVVGQNINFDLNIVGCEFFRAGLFDQFEGKEILDTCTEVTAQLCQIPGGRGGRYKLPTLTELHQFLFDQSFAEAHNATADVEATTRCFLELVRRGYFKHEIEQKYTDFFEGFIQAQPLPIEAEGLKHVNLKKASKKIRSLDVPKAESTPINPDPGADLDLMGQWPFAHLHNHSQFSILQSTSSTQDLIKAAVAADMPAVALTDTGNMMGAFHFLQQVEQYNKSIEAEPHQQPLKAIVGCEFFVCEDHTNKAFKDNGYQIVFLAKTKKGYHNLAKMSSKAFTDGFYYVPRIDKAIVEQYKEDLIVLTGNLYGEVPSKILNIGTTQAEEALLWWQSQFGADLYVEVMRHGQEDEERANEVLFELAQKHGIRLVATNNTYYIGKEDANAHDILLCVKDGEKQLTPIGKGRGTRYGLPNQEYYFKSSKEMKQLFADRPQAIESITEIINKIEPFSLFRDVLLPKFDIPEEFLDPEDAQDQGKRGENAYLKYLTFEGAKKRYPDWTPKIEERLNFELSVIENTGYPGYFLIVQDFIAQARKMDVSVGPGRGSAAGSAVAYCLWITNIDPIKYDLLFERFLNPDRVSLPDIDIDFDDEGRSRVMDYVIQKYGANQVAQIITYGTMAAKSSIRDTARVLDLPLHEADRIAKLIPNMSKLKNIFNTAQQDWRNKFRADEVPKVTELVSLSEANDLGAQTINQARVLEGSVRNTGIHACGVIITPDDITNFVPIATAKDSDLYVTQFDNAVVENAGLLKMDFLGLKTLTLIKDTVKLVRHKHGIELDPDAFPLDDEKTYALFQNGDTVGIFQYESPGMQKHLKDLKPTVFADLIAMNALYRPGPMEYIPSFVRRKHGEEEISYDLPDMEGYLKETYGITVYQEQVMLLSQKLAGFTKGEADVLRKAMGKKQKAVLDKMKPKFIEQAEQKNHPAEVLEKIWKDWEAFASYAFNKSHSTCYAWIAYQTAYLKAHYPAEYMAAVLSNNMNDMKQVTFFMEECRRMGLAVLGPDVNESFYKFTVNDVGAIRFGMGAVKGVGSSAVETIVANRKKERYKSIFDLSKRIDLRSANKKAFENLILAGGFDSFDTHRAQYMFDEGDGVCFYEKVLRYAAKYQESQNSSQVSLFGAASDVQIPEPELPAAEPWGAIKKLKQEKEVVGIYISGHPLDEFRTEMTEFCNVKVADCQDLIPFTNREIAFGGIISGVEHRVTRQGKEWGLFTLEDYDDSYEFRIFGEEYLKFRHFLKINAFLYIKAYVKEGWVNRDTGKRGEPRLQFNHFQLLHDVLESLAKKITFSIPIDVLDQAYIDRLKKVVEQHRGTKSVHLSVFDKEDNVHLSLSSRKSKVLINRELIKRLTQDQVYFKLN